MSDAFRAYKELKENLWKFAKVVCGNDVYDDIPDFHLDIYNLLMTASRVVIAAPRGFAKSALCSRIYPLYLALFKIRKDICIISASESLSTEHLRWIKLQLESNDTVIGMWGDLRSDKWTESHIIVEHKDGTKINIRAKGAGGQIRGFRPDVLILDDIETDDSVQSEDQRRKLKSWLFKACLNTLLPGGQMVLIGTIIHHLSVLNDLLDTPNDWEKRRLTAYIDGVEDEGHELWSARPHSWLQSRKREIGSAAFSAEFMNDPRADGTAPIREEHLRYWETMPANLGMVITVDPAYSEDEKSDWKVATLIGIDTENRRYLLEYIRTHAPSGEYMDSILNLYLRFKAYITGVGIPNSGVEKQFFQSFMAKAEERGIFPPIVELKNTFTGSTGVSYRNKKARIIAALQPIFEQGKYYIHPNHVEARDEILTIGSSRWDDVVDCMAGAEQIITPMYYEQKEFDNNKSRRPHPVGADSYGIEY